MVPMPILLRRRFAMQYSMISHLLASTPRKAFPALRTMKLFYGPDCWPSELPGHLTVNFIRTSRLSRPSCQNLCLLVNLSVFANRDIMEGEEIFVNYTPANRKHWDQEVWLPEGLTLLTGITTPATARSPLNTYWIVLIITLFLCQPTPIFLQN